MRNRRFEEADLAHCTFKPKTHWDLVAERRKKAREQRASERNISPSRASRATVSTKKEFRCLFSDLLLTVFKRNAFIAPI